MSNRANSSRLKLSLLYDDNPSSGKEKKGHSRLHGGFICKASFVLYLVIDAGCMRSSNPLQTLSELVQDLRIRIIASNSGYSPTVR
jgi:hypothetical protein